MASTPTPMRVALDWTPNTLHAPLLIAKSLRYFEDADLDVTFLTPSPSYDESPARKIQNGTADLALCPSETVLAYNTSAHPMRVEAVSALLKSDASRIATVPGILHPGELRGFRYGSYNARYEDAIVRAVVRNAGGVEAIEDDMDVIIVKDTGRLDLFEAMRRGEIEATWIFAPWEGVRSQLEGFPINQFSVGKYGVDYGYSPLIVRDRDHSPSDTMLRSFLAATKRAAEFLKDEPNTKKAVEIMKTWCPDETEDFLEKSLASVHGYLFDGRMDDAVWEKYVAWLEKEGLLGGDANKTHYQSLFTNEFHD